MSPIAWRKRRFSLKFNKGSLDNKIFTNRKAKRKLLGIGALIIGGAFVAIGISRGEVVTVFAKASIVCLECIGIG